ncbi:MAG: hypothetical protein ACREYE_33845 [Gammaproteobacteria bacterium]
MSETIAITGKSVKLFKGHYTSTQHIATAIASVLLPQFRENPSG